MSDIFFSIIIPAHNEEGCIKNTVDAIIQKFEQKNAEDYEIIVVNDNSSDATESILRGISEHYSQIRFLNNSSPNGFGFAVRKGLETFKGEAACIVMGDLSDSPDDIFTYYQKMKSGAECVFGSRFIKGSKVVDYPKIKLVVNRLVNWFIKLVFGIKHNDITNAFKCYRREVIQTLRPILSHHFNLTVELPLKAIVRGFSYETVPVSWTNRTTGKSKLLMKEMGSRYLFIVLYVLLEKYFSKGDYHRRQQK